MIATYLEGRRLHRRTRQLTRAVHMAHDLHDSPGWSWRLLLPRWWHYYVAISLGSALCRVRGHRWHGNDSFRVCLTCSLPDLGTSE